MKQPLPPGFERLAAEERAFLGSEFIAPVRHGQNITVRVAGIVLSLRVLPPNIAGWGVFIAENRTTARFLRHPKMSERSNYLKLYPCVRLLISGRTKDQWHGRLACMGRINLIGDAPVVMAEEVQLFDTVRARFDGGTFWFEGKESSRVRMANYLRAALNELSEPDALEFAGLTDVEQALYNEVYILRQAELVEAQRDKTEDRLRAALSHAGAVLQGYRELPDVYTVEYTVDGQRHTSVLAKNDLTIHSAGICLSGGDRAFDLQSLVGVIREGATTRRIVRVGINTDMEQDDDDDW